MALIAGAGNPLGSGGVGTGTSINYVGDHAFAYSGIIAVTNATSTMIDASTGNQYIVGKFQPSVNEDTSDNMFFKILIDGEEITATLIGSTTSNSPYEEIEVIIAPFTRFQVTCANASTSTGRNCAAVFTGRVYG